MSATIAPAKRKVPAPAHTAPTTPDPLAILLQHTANERECERIDAELESAAERGAWRALVAFLAGKTTDSAEAAEAITYLTLDDRELATTQGALRERARLEELAGTVEALERARAEAVSAVVAFNKNAAVELGRLQRAAAVARSRKLVAVAARDELDKWPLRHPNLAEALAD